LLAVLSPEAFGQTCPGDCNNDFQITVDEIVSGVTIALGESSVGNCPAFDTDGDGAVTVDEVIAAVDAALNGCPGQQFAFVIATDFETGSFGTVSFDDPPVSTPISSQRIVNSDAVARTAGGLVYVVNRFFGDSLQIIDPAQDFATTRQCLTGGGSNPQDFVFVGPDKGYVSLGGGTEVLVVDPSPPQDCSGFILDRIDLAEFADDDGNPELNQMAVVGDRLYVTLQKLDRDNFFVPAENGSVVVIDLGTDEALGEIILTGQNPFAQTKGITTRDGDLFLSEVGNFGVNDGGIERIDAQSQMPQGFFVTEEDLGGDIVDFVLTSDDGGYAVVSLPDFSNAVVAFDASEGGLTQTLISGESVSDIELNELGQLFVAQRTPQSPGIRIFDVHDNNTELTAAPIDLDLPPFDIVFVR
jgi:hypothetical protein